MASTFKTFLPEDIATTRTLLHEAIPITGTIISGTYGDENIKTYTHGMFESVYDYPFLSSSANHIFDITWGYSNNSAHSGTTAGHIQNAKKINIYNEMALVLTELDISGNIRDFDRDGEIDDNPLDDMQSVLFLNFTRLLMKDEIKKGSFSLTLFSSGCLGVCAPAGALTIPITLSDTDAISNYKINSPAGEYGLLFTGTTSGVPVGHLYYQAGIAVITSSIFIGQFGNLGLPASVTWTGSIGQALTGASITELADGLRHTVQNIQFNNTTELNSTIYFCRAHNTDFNYSSNPTYLSSSEIIVKNNNPMANPVSYMTTVGLYSPDNELMAVAKVSEPLKKSPANEITLRVRLDY